MTTHPSDTARASNASSCTTTIPFAHDANAHIALQRALSQNGAAESSERTMHSHRRISPPGQPPDGGV